MITVNDIHYRNGVSDRPRFVVFQRMSEAETGEIFWAPLSTAESASEALFKANLSPMYPDAAFKRFVTGTTITEADNLIRSGVRFSDDEFASYRSPYPMAAE
jgi:hypothetical protein